MRRLLAAGCIFAAWVCDELSFGCAALATWMDRAAAWVKGGKRRA